VRRRLPWAAAGHGCQRRARSSGTVTVRALSVYALARASGRREAQSPGSHATPDMDAVRSYPEPEYPLNPRQIWVCVRPMQIESP
jgi:hypothetical protein